MIHYQSNNYYKSDYIVAVFIPLILSITLTYFLRDNFTFLLTGTAFILLLLGILLYLLFNLCKVEFHQDSIKIQSLLSKKVKTINYIKIEKFTHITAYAGTSRDKIKYYDKKHRMVTMTALSHHSKC